MPNRKYAHLALGLLVFGMICNLATMLMAVAYDRSLYIDGAPWIFQLFFRGQLIFDHDYCRYFSTWWEIPTLLVVRLFPDADMTAIGVRLFDICSELHPLVSLAACYWILKRKQKIEFMLFPLLTFAWVTQAMMTFAAGIAPDSVSLFWPLFFLVLFPNSESKIEILVVFLLSSALAFTYEPALLFFALLGGLSIYRYRCDGKKKIDFAQAILFFVGMLWLSWRAFGPKAGRTQFFFSSLLNTKDDVYRLMTFSALATWILYVALKSFSRRWFLSILALEFLGYLIYTAFFFRYDNYLFNDYTARTTAIPMTFAIACLALWIWKTKSERLHLFSGKSSVWIKAALGVALTAAACNDGLCDWNWAVRYYAMLDIINTKQGPCFVIPTDEENQFAKMWTFLPQTSILIQKSRHVHAVFFLEDMSIKQPAYNYCKSLAENVVTETFFFPAEELHKQIATLKLHVDHYFDFSEFRKYLTLQETEIPTTADYYIGDLTGVSVDRGRPSEGRFRIFSRYYANLKKGEIFWKSQLETVTHYLVPRSGKIARGADGTWSTVYRDWDGVAHEVPVRVDIQDGQVRNLTFTFSMRNGAVERLSVEFVSPTEPRSTGRIHEADGSLITEYKITSHRISASDFARETGGDIEILGLGVPAMGMP